MRPPDYAATYKAHLAQLTSVHGVERAMELVVGGKFLETGAIEKSALLSLGLKPNHTIVDVGCGSGRLPYQLREYLTGKFIGTDVLEDALAYARKNCGRSDWEFIANDRSTIPVANASADFVTFFSVFTHLLDEDAYRFLLEAKRVLKSDGRVVFSFLDFDCDSHWPDFLKMVADENPDRVLNKFITRSTVARWARGVGLRIEAIHDGADKWVPLEDSIPCEDGTILKGSVSFGQSVAVLSVFQEDIYLARYPDVRSAIQAGYFQSGAHHYDVCGFREGRIR